MNEMLTQNLIDELQSLYPKFEIRIQSSCQYYEDGQLTPHLIVMFGENYGSHFETGFIHKETGELKLESELNIETELKDYYEFFEGGFEDNINECLMRMIANIKKFKK